MSAALRSRRAFSSIDLLVVLTVLALVLMLLQPAVQQARETAHRNECTNNLKLIGLAMHSFHDVRRETCPSYLSTDPAAFGPCHAEGYATWHVLLLPYLEQASMYDLIDLKTPLTTDSPGGKRAESHKLVRLTSVANFFCPSRRTPPKLTAGGEGSVGDYANVSYGEAAANTPVKHDQPRTYDGAMMVCRAFNATDAPNTTVINGFPVGTLKAGEFRSMTSYASVIDGLSNTAMIGEKAVHEERLGKSKIDGSEQDGTIYFGVGKTVDSYTAPGPMAYWSRRLAPEKEGAAILPAKPLTEDPDNRFGGWHPDVTIFLMGDGRVKPVRNDESNTTLQRLGTRNDRLTFDLK